MKALRMLCLAILFAAASFLPQASATSFTTDQSDVWSVQGEDGWGFQIIQRGSVIFVTMYVYDGTRTPIWYTATLFYQGNFVWSGDLIVTTGPWFGTVPFSSNTVTRRKVGTMQWTATSVTTGELRYDVDGVPVVKNASRLFIALDDFSGRYSGGLHSDVTGCTISGYNGTNEDIGILTVAQNGQAMVLTSLPTGGGSCAFTGTLTQAGQMGAVNGSYSCSDGDTGAFQIFEMQVNISGLTGRFTATSNVVAGCKVTGWFGGVRVTTF